MCDLHNPSWRTCFFFCALSFLVIKLAGTWCSCWFALWICEWVCTCKRARTIVSVCVRARIALEGQHLPPAYLQNGQERKLWGNLLADNGHSWRNGKPPRCVCPKSQFQNTWGKKLTDLKGKIDEFTMILGDFSAPLSVIYRTSRPENN